ncbi:MAG TPA: FAD-binding oxidoreductase [Candidatus Polarisedimenticolia bacterium]|nr:FAD-binding oxidoreductase [Candidatus Polarisedimenticolia bacterium]
MLARDVDSSVDQELKRAVGAENVSNDAATLKSFALDCSLVTGTCPDFVVFPRSKAEVCAIVRIANQHRIALVPVSSGPPRFHGDTLPSRGGIVVDFRRMRQVIKVDTVSRCAMVEPGVTFGELVPALEGQGMRLNAPLASRANKSVVTSCLEREATLIPKYQYDSMDPLLTVEVIYGSGDEFRTGSASGPGPPESLKAAKVNPWGPGAVDYYRLLSAAQGTMGLVTWGVIRTEVLPTLRKLYFIPLDRPEQLSAPLDALLRKRVVDECLALNDASLATLLAEDARKDFASLKAALPPWTIIACVAGYQRRAAERVAIQEQYLSEVCGSLGLQAQTRLPGAPGLEEAVLRVISRPWSKEPYWKLRRTDRCYELFFLAPLSKAGYFVEMMQDIVAKSRCRGLEYGAYVQPLVQGREAHCAFLLPFESSNKEEAAAAGELFLSASETLMSKGAFFSRPYGPWAPMVYRNYADGAAMLKTLKSIFDPNGILNPGKLCF